MLSGAFLKILIMLVRLPALSEPVDLVGSLVFATGLAWLGVALGNAVHPS